MVSSYRAQLMRALHWQHLVAPVYVYWNPSHCVKRPHNPPEMRMTAGQSELPLEKSSSRCISST